MAKQIYNYELFTNKKDELAKIRKKAARNRRIKILLLALILAGTAIVAYILFNSKCNYYTYKDKVEEDKKAKELAKAEEARKLAEYNLKNKQK